MSHQLRRCGSDVDLARAARGFVGARPSIGHCSLNPWRDQRWYKDHRAHQQGAAGDCDLRCRPDADTATQPGCRLGHQRNRTRGRSAYARERNPITSLMAEDGIRALARALPLIMARPADREARTEALYGAWLCGVCLGTVGMAPHHKLCHTLGGTFDLPHAQTHAVVLPHALAYNAPAEPPVMARIARAVGAADAAQGLYDLIKQLDATLALRDIGMPESSLEQAAGLALTNAYWNPRPLERGAIRDLIARAWMGEAPASCKGFLVIVAPDVS